MREEGPHCKATGGRSQRRRSRRKVWLTVRMLEAPTASVRAEVVPKRMDSNAGLWLQKRWVIQPAGDISVTDAKGVYYT